MRHVLLCALLATVPASAIAASDKPLIGPVPAWVKPVPLPAMPAADDAPIRILLTDQQVSIEPTRQTVYAAARFLIQTPQGLAAGNISLPWRPDTDVLTVHAVRIHRGATVIDVLGSGQTFTVVRREPNLEGATLDGVLTANIQPEGLQVGDQLEVVTSLTASDPVLRGHAELLGAMWNVVPITRAHLSMTWPATMPLRLRSAGTLPVLRPTRVGPLARIDLQQDDLKPLVLPKGAPARFRYGRVVEATDYAGWADLAALMAPLYRTAATLPADGPLRAEVARIRALSPDPRLRAEAALALVQDRVRYVALAMGAGGLVPAGAAETWARRYGDCKGKTALLIGLLAALDIPAEPVLVSTVYGDGLDQRLPMIGLFDHVIVRATVAGRTYFMDGTRTGDTALDRLTEPGFGWGLPVVPTGAALVRMMPPPLAVPIDETIIRIDATAGLTLPAPVHIEQIFRGDPAQAARLGLATLSGTARDNALRDYWRGRYNFIDATTTTASFDQKTGEQRFVLNGKAHMKWADYGYETDGTAIGYKADFSRDPGPDAQAPFTVPYPYFARVHETILLPPGFGQLKAGGKNDVDRTIAGIAYRRTSSLTGNVFTIEKTERSIAPEFPFAEAAAAQAALRALGEEAVYLRKPADYRPDKAEIDARLAVPSTDADELTSRARALIGTSRYAEALAPLNAALAVDPRHVSALVARTEVRIAMRDLSAAKTDLDAAAAINPASIEILNARGTLAEATTRPRDAIAAYDRVLELDPTNAFALGRRAVTHAALGEPDLALADAAAVLKLNPTLFQVVQLRADLLYRKGDHDGAIAEIEAAVTAYPRDLYAHIAAARFYQHTALRPVEALAALDRAIAISPSAGLYAERSTYHADTDVASAHADLGKALKLDPSSISAMAQRAKLANKVGNNATAITDWTRLITANPGDGNALEGRARAHLSAGNLAAALVDADAAVSGAPNDTQLLLLRANIYTAMKKPDDALKQADLMLAAAPTDTYPYVAAAAIYGKFHKDAQMMASYDRALAIKPDAAVYYERTIHRPSTDRAGRRADLDAALALDPQYEQALMMKAEMAADDRDFTSAIDYYTRYLAVIPGAVSVRAARGAIQARIGHRALADQDASDVRRVGTAEAYNTLCWASAVNNVGLTTALADCDAAVAKKPTDPGIIHSRALIMLRLDRFDDAIADYTRALSLYPAWSFVLYGRAVAYARRGDSAKSAADVAAALKIDPAIATEYRLLDLTL